jgi:DNA-binding NarL/FixJ family response regulator
MTVFLVDDSAPLRERLAELLAELPGLQVVGQAAGVSEALGAIDRAQPDLVILDLRLKDGSGIEVLEQLKSRVPSPAVIVLTNYPYPQYRKRCLEMGAEFFFEKQAETGRLLEVVQHLAHSVP